MGSLTWVLVPLAIAAILASTSLEAGLSIALVYVCLLGVVVIYQRSASCAGPTRINVPLEQVNDSLYELHRPEGNPTMQVLFFHGLQLVDMSDAHVGTWKSEDGSLIWPRDWLVEDFPSAQIFTISYNKGVANLDMLLVGENLTSDLIHGGIGQVPYCPVILVGYCVGGLVMKQICLQAKKKFDSGKISAKQRKKLGLFLDSVRGVFYYGTPHRGSSLIGNIGDGPLFRYFKVLNEDAARLNSDFDDLRVSYPKWRVDGLGESLPTKSGLFQGHLVVPEGASREGEEFHVVPADHNSICQPRNKVDRRFYALKDLIDSIVTNMEEEVKAQKETSVQEARPHNFQPLPSGIVGIDARVRTIVGKLDSVRKLGFAGMGGLGKSTLAKAVFNELGSRFEYTCFVSNMKLIGGTGSDATNAVWEHMHHHGRKVEGGQSWSSLKGRKLLLVLDDISLRDEKVLHDFADNSSPESRFIVTCRDEDLLSSLDAVFVVPFLDSKTAEALFMKCAFPNQAEPPKELEIVMKSIIQKCDGLPLTLEVLGKYLKRIRDVEHWEETLNALRSAEEISGLNERLWEKLRPSFDDLKDMEKQIFLDATTFFCTSFLWTLRDAIAAWRTAYGVSGKLLWQTLVDRSLVYSVGEDDIIRVHEQLRSLGQKIASEPSNAGKCRVWDSEVAYKMLQTLREELDGKEIHALRMHTQLYTVDWDPVCIHLRKADFCKLKKVQFLDTDGPVTIDGEDGVTVPTEVVLLKCADGDLFNPALQTRLAVLDVTCTSEDPLPHSVGQLEGLKHLRCRSYARTLPNSFGNLRALQRLTLYGSRRLESLPGSFGQLSSLNYLGFTYCDNLHTLPESFGQLKALRHLECTGCVKLESLPTSFGHLSSLNYLKFFGCDNLHTLPESFGQLKALRNLEFRFCSELESLPESFGQLKALRNLKFEFCSKLESLPESFGDLNALNTLSVSSVDNFHTLPQSFGQLSTLTYLDLWCQNLRDLPESFGQLTKLERLRIYAKNMERWLDSFGDLKGLRDLTIGYYPCTSIPDSIQSLPALQRFELKFVRDVVEPLPPWLVTPSHISEYPRVVFEVQDGRFSFIFSPLEEAAW